MKNNVCLFSAYSTDNIIKKGGDGMGACYVDNIKTEDGTQFFLRSSDDMSIIREPSKYLKHKMKEHCSPNTIRRIAYAICYYISFITERGLTVEGVLKMKYAEQHEHFTDFLFWVQAGNHCDRKELPSNNTCNSYLQSVFGYFEFVLLEYEVEGDIKVFENRDISYSGTAGVRFRRSVKMFKGYLPSEESIGRTIDEDNIKKLLEASDSVRNRLLILLLAETGFRIGELLGVKYGTDIDFDKHTLKVTYREDNENEARAKNAEIRRAKISDETYEILLYYISENRYLLSKTEYLFVNMYGEHKGEPLTVNAVYSAFAVLERRTGIEVTPHMLRHYFANERRKKGWTLDKISQALGHKQLATTEKYMNIEDSEMAAAMDKYYEENKGLFDIDKLI